MFKAFGPFATALADTYSASGNTEAGAALTDVGSAGGKTVRLRDGAYGGGRGVMVDGRVFTSEVVITADDRAGAVFGETWIEDSEYLTFDGVTFYVASGTHLVLYGTNSNITIKNCDIYGTTIDPEGDYSSSGPTAAAGLNLHGASTHTDISILNNYIHDCAIGVVGGAAGTFRIQGNHIENVYEDCIKINGNAGIVIISDNYLAGVIANGFDAGNPHADFIQFLGKGSDWTGIEIDRNIIVATHSRAAAQGMFLDDMSAGFYYSGTKIRGNLIVQKGGLSTGIRVRQAKNVEVYGNTVVSQLLFTAEGPGIVVGEDTTTGTHLIKNNVADRFSISGAATITNNRKLGIGGEAIGYGTVFNGSAFDPDSRASALTEFEMKANGPLDRADTYGDVGAVGSGYVTWASTNPGNDGSLDSNYESYTPPTTGSPMDLFNSLESGFFYDTTTADDLYQSAGLTTPVTTDGQTVSSITDASRNGSDGAVDTGEAPTWGATDKGISFDGSQSLYADWELGSTTYNMGFIVQTTDTQGTLVPAHNTHVPWMLPIHDGSTETSITDNSGSPSIYIDGVLFSGNRDAFHTAVSDGNPHFVEIRAFTGGGTNSWNGNKISFGIYSPDAIWNYTGIIGSPYVTTNNDTATLDSVRSWYATNYGITFPT